MKYFKNYIQEKLILNKNSKNNEHIKYYVLLGIYEGFDYLTDKFGNELIEGDLGSGPSIFIINNKKLLSIDKKYLDDGSISVWNISEKYQNNIDQFKKDYYNGKINLEDNSYELDEDELNKILNK